MSSFSASPSSPKSSDVFGFDAGKPVSLFCPPGEFVTGIKGRSTSQGMSSITFTCDQHRDLGTVGNPLLGLPFRIDCPQGIRRVTTNTDGTVVEAVQAVCQDGNPSDQNGGAGTFTCPEGAKILGAQIYGLDKINAIQWWCGTPAPKSKVTTLPTWGDMTRGGFSYVLTCPPGTDITGLRGTSDRHGITSLGLSCADRDLQTVGLGMTGRAFDLDCGKDSIDKISSFNSDGKQKIIVVGCQGDSQQDGLSTETDDKVDLGSFYQCPADQSLQAALVRAGVYVNGIQFICGPANSPDSSAGDWVSVLGLVVLLIVLILAVVGVVVWWRRRRKA